MSLQRARHSISKCCWCDALLKPATSTRVPAWAVRMHYGATMQQYTPASFPACTHIAYCVDWVEVHASESEPQCACINCSFSSVHSTVKSASPQATYMLTSRSSAKATACILCCWHRTRRSMLITGVHPLQLLRSGRSSAYPTASAMGPSLRSAHRPVLWCRSPGPAPQVASTF